MKRTKIVPLADELLGVLESFDAALGDGDTDTGAVCHAGTVRLALAQASALLSVARAAASDPDPHHRVEAALSRLRRLSAPAAAVKGNRKLPANSRGATRKGAGR